MACRRPVFDAVQRRGGKGLTQEYTCNCLFLLFSFQLDLFCANGYFSGHASSWAISAMSRRCQRNHSGAGWGWHRITCGWITWRGSQGRQMGGDRQHHLPQTPSGFPSRPLPDIFITHNGLAQAGWHVPTMTCANEFFFTRHLGATSLPSSGDAADGGLPMPAGEMHPDRGPCAADGPRFMSALLWPPTKRYTRSSQHSRTEAHEAASIAATPLSCPTFQC